MMTSDQKINILLRSYGYLWVLYITYGAVFGILTIWYPELTENDYKQNGILEMLESNPVQFAVLACIFAPVVEEMMFRTLIKPSHSDIILFIISWSIFIGIRYLPSDIHWIIQVLFTGVIIYVLYILLKQLIPESSTFWLRTKLTKRIIPVFILTSLLFELVHISNYVDAFIINLTLIVIIIPRIIAGFMLGWIKIKNEHLGWSIALHFINNVVPVFIMIVSQQITAS